MPGNSYWQRDQPGKIGGALSSIEEEKTPLQLQINNFVKKMAVAGIIIFLIVWGINYAQSSNIFDSLLKALTLAMSILPEEIPVAFTTFMALGAWRLMKTGVIVKQTRTVETLGSASVICVDKTGTITENRMELTRIFVPGEKGFSIPVIRYPGKKRNSSVRPCGPANRSPSTRWKWPCTNGTRICMQQMNVLFTKWFMNTRWGEGPP